MVKGGANDIAIMAAIVAFGAGYITTQQGQNALKAATEARYLAPIDVFVFSSLTALFLAVMSERVIVLKLEYPAVCMMFACSAIADILLHNRASFAWTVYLPPAFAFLVLVIPDRVTKSLFKGVGAIHRLGWIVGSNSSAPMAIRERLSAIQVIPV